MDSTLEKQVIAELIDLGCADEHAINMAFAVQQRTAIAGKMWPLTDILVRMGIISKDEAEQATRRASGDEESVTAIKLSPALLRRLKVMPIEIRSKVLHYAHVDPISKQCEAELLAEAAASGYEVDSVVVRPKSRADVIFWLNQLSSVDRDLVQREATQLCEGAYGAPLMHRFINHMLEDAIQSRASDIHLERSNDITFCWISFRIDGVLRRRISLNQKAMASVCTRIKTTAGIDISETRRAQDGRFSAEHIGKNLDLRVSCVPDHDGETITIRILDQTRVPRLDYVFRRHPLVRDRLRSIANIRMKSSGIVLVTGPTGQGKSTTLAALLWEMRRTTLKIMTIEDPVETQIPFVHQSAINPQAGATYGSLLRAFMRQDPDVMMIGEIRDEETAQEFLKGAETGHLMLSTEHTTDVVSSVSRLVNLLPPDMRRNSLFTIASTIRAVLNQRLLPALCQCSVPDNEGFLRYAKVLALLGYRPEMNWNIKRKRGCQRCDHTGYYGRELVIEGAFFPALPQIQAEIEHHLLHGSPEKIVKCKGVQHYTRAEAIRNLVSSGLIDLSTAEAGLDLFVEAGNE